MFSETFVALNKEAQFTREMLGSGATQIRHANYASKGVYFQAFTSLSTGLERIGKLCVMIDHYLDHGGAFPAPEDIRKLSHKIGVIYQRSASIVVKRSIALEFLPNLDGEIHQAILLSLSAFAVSDRYANINLLVGDGKKSDPIALWAERVDNAIFERCVSEKKKTLIRENAQVVGMVFGPNSMVVHASDSGKVISDFESASRHTGVYEAIAPYRQLLTMQIIRYWVEILSFLQHEAMSAGSHDIPYFTEIFAPFMNDDTYLKTRKTWVGI